MALSVAQRYHSRYLLAPSSSSPPTTNPPVPTRIGLSSLCLQRAFDGFGRARALLESEMMGGQEGGDDAGRLNEQFAR